MRYDLHIDSKLVGRVEGDLPRVGDLIDWTGGRQCYRVKKVVHTLEGTKFIEGASHVKKFVTVYAEWAPEEG